MKLERVVLHEIRLPLRQAFRISSGVVHERRILLLELTAAGGATTWSECVAGATPNYSPETIDTVWLALDQWLLPRVLGTSFDGPEAVSAVLGQDVRGHRMAKAAVEMGMWALASLERGLPLADLLYLACEGRGEDDGTQSEPHPRSRVPVGLSMGIQDSPPELVEIARAGLAQGYRKLKIKIAPGRDVHYVRAVRAALGPDAPLMVDANASYSLDDAEHLALLDDFDLVMIEQPLAPTDLLRHARLQQRLATPLCLDESITGPDKVEDMLALEAGRIVNIKPGRVGGFGPSLMIHDLCSAAEVPVWCGGMLESGIGRAYNVALASLPNFTLPGDLSPSARYWERDIVDPEWTMDAEGWVRVPRERPGLGVDVDRARIIELAVRTQEYT